MVNPLGAEIFVSTWDIKDVTRSEKINSQLCDQEGFTKLYQENLKSFSVFSYEKVEKDFKKFAIIDRPFDVYSTSNRAKNHGLYWQERLRSMWWLTSKGIQDIEKHEKLNGFEYDVIIKSRTDFEFKDAKISEQLIKTKKRTLYVNGLGSIGDVNFSDWNILCDWYFFGDGYVMKHMISFCEEIAELYESHNVDCSHAEAMFYIYTVKKGIGHIKLSVPIFKA